MNTAVSPEYPAPRLRTWKGLIEGPLRQAAVLLWLVGGWRLWGQVLGHQITWEWVVAAGIATLAAFLLIAQLRVLWLSFVPVALGLGVVLGIGHQFDLGFDGFCILTSTYALTLWVVVPRVLATSSMTRLGEFLGLAGGHGESGGRVRIRAALHGTGLTVLVIALIGVSLAPIFGAAIRSDGLWTVGLAALFFWLTGWHYRSRFHSYSLCSSPSPMEPGLRSPISRVGDLIARFSWGRRWSGPDHPWFVFRIFAPRHRSRTMAWRAGAH